MAPESLQDHFTELYSAEADSVYRFCLLRTSDKEVALDIMQDTFIRLWEVLLRGEQKIGNDRALLFTIARNRIIDWYRKKKSLSLDTLSEKSGNDKEFYMTTDEKEDIEMAYEAKYLVELIGKIDPLNQQAVYFRFIEGLEPREIGIIIGQSANVVSVRIHRGLKQLRKLAGYEEPKHEK